MAVCKGNLLWSNMFLEELNHLTTKFNCSFYNEIFGITTDDDADGIRNGGFGSTNV